MFAVNVITMKTYKIKTDQRPILLIISVLVLVSVGTGCNTVRGLGRDVEKTGEHIESGAR